MQGGLILRVLGRKACEASSSHHRGIRAQPAAPGILSYEELVIQPKGDLSGNREQHDIVVAHGLLGSGRNWRTATKVMGEKMLSLLQCTANDTLDANPNVDLRFLLFDLRHHGKSAEAFKNISSNTLNDAADDIATSLIERNGGSHPSIHSIIGHSLGGKIAMAYMERHAARQMRRGGQVWVLDSTPGRCEEGNANSDVANVLNALLSVRFIQSRKWLIEHLQEQGFSSGLASWLAGSGLKAAPGGGTFEFNFNLEEAKILYEDYMSTNYLQIMRRPPPGIELHHLRGDLSDRWNETALKDLEEAARASNGSSHLHRLERAGHWIHTDNLAGMVDIMAPHLARTLTS